MLRKLKFIEMGFPVEVPCSSLSSNHCDDFFFWGEKKRVFFVGFIDRFEWGRRNPTVRIAIGAENGGIGPPGIRGQTTDRSIQQAVRERGFTYFLGIQRCK